MKRTMMIVVTAVWACGAVPFSAFSAPPETGGGLCLPGLMAWWPLDAVEGGMVRAAGPESRPGVLRHFAEPPSFEDGYLRFDGQDDFVEIEDPSPFLFDHASFSVSAWLQVRRDENKYRHGVVIYNDEEGFSPRFKLSKIRNGMLEGRLYFQLVDSGEQALLASRQTGAELPKDAWMHLVAVADREHATMRFYLDGVLQAEGPLPSVALSSGERMRMRFGKLGPYGTHEGPMAHVQIYGRALSGEEVLLLSSLQKERVVRPSNGK